jgi:FdhD protein
MVKGKKEIPEQEILRYEGVGLLPAEHRPVREFPVKLVVNGRELATLIGSPHELRFLVAGFLRLQGFVKSLDDFLALSICEDMGVASVQIRGEVPETLRPVLTTGCGSGITFSIPAPPVEKSGGETRKFIPAAIFALMDELARRAGRYRSHGGIHSAAVGDGTALILYAEDIGRHNTLDRIAGEALLRGIDLVGKLLITSGRVSSEMVAKASSLGISLIASRTSPTDIAARLCQTAGITLLGYVRGGKFNVYAHPARLDVPMAEGGTSPPGVNWPDVLI